MKNIAVAATALMIWFSFCVVGAYGLGAAVSDLSVTGEQENGLEITGSLPEVSGLTDAAFQTGLNELIQQEYTDRVEAAVKDSAKRVEFAYAFLEDSGYYSIVMTTQTTAVSVKDEVRTFVFGTDTGLQTVNDVLGPNGVKIVNQVITAEMSQKPGTYNADFAGITEEQSFYVADGAAVVIFNKFAIGPGALGTPVFSVNISGVRSHSFTIGRNDSYTKEPYTVKMIPLRAVATALGFEVVWDARTQSIDVTRGGALAANLSIDKNSYFKSRYPAVALEYPPELSAEGVTHLPISFFERILDACYTVDQAGSITFSYYEAP